MIQFDAKISLGHLLQAGMIVVALAAGWLTSRDKMHDLEADVANQKQAVSALQSRLDNFETNTVGTINRLQNLLTDLRIDIGNRGLGAARR